MRGQSSGIMLLREFQMEERRFELRAGQPVFDAFDDAAQVEHARTRGPVSESSRRRRRRSSEVRAR